MTYKDEYEQAGMELPSILRAGGKLRRDHLGKPFIVHSHSTLSAEKTTSFLISIDHCIELLRIDMMCQADVTPYLVVEAAPGDPSETLNVDFSVFKKCRDFGKIKDWMKDHIAVGSVRDSQNHDRV
jgi:hypothetical protein